MKKQSAMLLALMLLAGAAAAQSKAENGVYAGIEGAYVNTPAQNAPTGFRKTSETNDVGAVRVLVGYQFNKNLGLELGYFNTGDTKQSGTDGAINYDVKIKAEGEDLAVIYKFTEGLPGLFLKAGVSYSKVSGSASARLAGLTTSATGSQSGTGYVAGLGYEFNVSGGLDARLGYTRYDHIGGQSDNKMNMFSAGLKYRF